jgi:hypothetical protein
MAGLLYIVLICLVILLIALVEAVILAFLKWASFGQCLASSAIANFLSTIITILLIVWVKQPHISYLAIGWVISVLADTFILHLFKRQPASRTLLSAMLANLVSYLILILPVFYFGQRG